MLWYAFALKKGDARSSFGVVADGYTEEGD
jgi:hypothetical protein